MCWVIALIDCFPRTALIHRRVSGVPWLTPLRAACIAYHHTTTGLTCSVTFCCLPCNSDEIGLAACRPFDRCIPTLTLAVLCRLNWSFGAQCGPQQSPPSVPTLPRAAAGRLCLVFAARFLHRMRRWYEEDDADWIRAVGLLETKGVVYSP